ncbi:MAG: phosphoribosylformylglycinamidine cyclo-ligase, partial [Chloroflexota bacterium]|nr:phosphoribosylformylglycinamidine cyclo-ligase [Chloroflexota bacterium]
RALPTGLGAAIDRSTWTVPPLFTLRATMGGVPEHDRWVTWNMGIGLVVTIDPADERAALRALPDAISIGRVERASGPTRVRFV